MKKKFGRRTSTEGYVLVNKSGRKNYKNIKKLKELINANPNYDIDTKRDLVNELDEIAQQRHTKNKKGNPADNKQLTSTSFFARLETDEIKKRFANLGYTSAELAAEYGLDEKKLLNKANWKKTQGGWIFDNGNAEYTFTWTYTGSVFTRI